MFQVRGENIYPSEIDAVLNTVDGYGGEHRIVISREGAMDELLVRVEPAAAAGPDFGERCAAALLKVLGVRTRVEVTALDEFPRTDFKARRVIDDRDMFRSLMAGGKHGA